MNHQTPQPARWAQRFFRWYCNRSHCEHLEGDLLELFERNARQHGIGKAKWMYVRDVLLLLRPFTLRRPSTSHRSAVYVDKFWYYIKTTLRSLKRNYSYTIINILGLSLGLLVSSVILLRVAHDLNFDHGLKDVDRIYRIVVHQEERRFAGVPGPIPEKLALEIPQIEALSIIDRNLGHPIVGIVHPDGQISRYRETNTASVWPEHLKIFQYQWIEGDSSKALDNPHSVIITERLAAKYFGSRSALGESISLDGDDTYKITGVIRDPLQSTNFPFDMYISKAGDKIPTWMKDNWFAFAGGFQCFVKLRQGTNPVALEMPFKSFLDRHQPDENEENYELQLQPVREMHLDPRYHSFSKPTVSKGTLWSLGAIAFFLMISAIINFINLNTAFIFQRVKEVGLRKVLGSSKSEIFRSVIGETAFILLIPFCVVALLLPVVLDQAQFLLGESLSISLIWELQMGPHLMAMGIVIILAAGLYPAWLMQRINPVLAMKNRVDEKFGRGIGVRKGLLLIQFAICQLLIICMITAMQQMSLFNSAALGFDHEALVEVPIPSKDIDQLTRIRTRFEKGANIQSVCFSNSGVASDYHWKYNFSYFPIDSSPEIRDLCQVKLVDEAYISTYDIELVEGANFQRWDTLPHAIVNQKFLQTIEIKDPGEALDQQVNCGGRTFQIVGVAKDFTTQSLHHLVEPVIIFPSFQSPQICGIKLATGGSLGNSLAFIESVWTDEFPQDVFRFEFLDDKIEAFYNNEQRATRLFQWSAGIAIFIGMLGLIGLVSLAMVRKTKEVGIRKVLGSSGLQILGLFVREFVWIIFLSFLIASPVAWKAMKTWLDAFPHRVNVEWDTFVWALLISLGTMALIVWLRSYRVVTMNPAEAMREDT